MLAGKPKQDSILQEFMDSLDTRSATLHTTNTASKGAVFFQRCQGTSIVATSEDASITNARKI